MTRQARTYAVVLLTSLTMGASAVAPQVAPRSGEPLVVHPEATEAIGGIKSPYCPGQMLATCSSPGAAAIRDSIQKMAEGGLAADSIIEAVLAQYGQQWRATPPSDGTGLWAWLVPPVVLALGLSMVGVVLARRERSPEAATATAAPSTEDDRRLRDAMRALDEEEAAAF